MNSKKLFSRTVPLRIIDDLSEEFLDDLSFGE